ncbi:MAG: hypothetical protein A3C11_02300 [Candidatus Sungbacteria bacterium RIFCSPHIGHO2_02_FULL_49_12]|uniref:Uncharacterized protein n=1 Tax=Candidatus Sungbacteria bacterium RIFCSPHIGHO2_02_FULL_49_12 TaxID=1802271 RepID=A0A1G2KLS8_9BACT|nr:MAG: hypothetical protein A3C11_02300 [Candidatus Sungbacteria bacterium RIFCSPHIGHO2_02_FULL_49_12]
MPIFLRRKEVIFMVIVAVTLISAVVFRMKIQSFLGVSEPRISIVTGQPLPKYQGRDIREIREVPEEVKLFTEDQKKVIHQRILDAAGSIDVNPDVLDPWLQLGLYKKVIGDYEGARDAWEYASIIRPQNLMSFKNLGELYWHYLPDFPRAEKNLRTAIQNEPTYIDSYITLHEIYRYSYKEKADAADDVLLEGLVANPDHRDLIAYLARYYKETGNKGGAIEYYRKLQRFSPEDADIRDELRKLGAE